MPQDCLGNPISATRDATLQSIDEFVGGYLAYETRAEGIVAAAEADAESCLANVYAGLLWMFLEAPDAASRAAKYLAAAERVAAASGHRERLHVALLRAWAGDDIAQCLDICERVTDEFPRDLVIVKIHQYLEFNRGNSPAMLRVVLKVLDQNRDSPYAYGMLAFAYEQCHLMHEAETAARKALQLRRKEPWAQHALAHVMLTEGRIDEGTHFLEGMQDTWSGLNSFMVTHIWWHLALFYLSQGKFAKALDIYDRRCWAVAKEYSQDQVGAVSLLARLELAGVDVGDRWREIGAYLAVRAHDTVLPFLTMQYLYGLARAGRIEADELLNATRQKAAHAPAFSQDSWREVALPACEGLVAHARGEFDAARRLLAQAAPRLAETGGSHAQRDLFDLVLLDATIQSNHLVEAQQALELRRASDADGVPVNTALSLVYAKLGLDVLASQAQQRAVLTRNRHPE